MFFCFFGWSVLSVGMFVGGGMVGPVFVIPALLISFSGYIFLALMGSALKGIYTAALYRYAMTGDAGVFDNQILGNAFRHK